MDPHPPPIRLTVVIPTLDTRELTAAALASLAGGGAPAEVVVVDDGSSDGTSELLARRFPAVRVLRNERPAGFTASANRGLAAAGGDLLLLLNSDTEVDPGALARLLDAFAADPRLGIAGATLVYPDRRPQWSGGAEPSLPWLFALASGVASLLARFQPYRLVRPPGARPGGEVGWVTGAAMAIRRRLWEELGPFDEGYRLYGQDLDLCGRARRAGWSVRILPEVVVAHHRGATVDNTARATPGRQDPTRLWPDLLHWAERVRGPAFRTRAAAALRWGARLRLAGRILAGALLLPSRRTAWRQETGTFRRALDGLDDRRPRDPARPA